MTNGTLFPDEFAIVTGAASNIGRAIAISLAREGASVLLVDVNPDGNAETAQAIKAFGGTAQTLTVDLSARDGWHKIIDAIDGRHPSMLVHAAAPARKEIDHAMAVSGGNIRLR